MAAGMLKLGLAMVRLAAPVLSVASMLTDVLSSARVLRLRWMDEATERTGSDVAMVYLL